MTMAVIMQQSSAERIYRSHFFVSLMLQNADVAYSAQAQCVQPVIDIGNNMKHFSRLNRREKKRAFHMVCITVLTLIWSK